MALISEYPHPSPQVQFGCIDYADEETTSLILQCHMEDLDYLLRMAKGKAREGNFSDSAIAFDLYKEEIITQIRLMSDRKMSLSIAKAVQSDGPLLHNNLLTEERERRDRNLACNVAGVNNLSGTEDRLAGSTVDKAAMDDELLDKLAAIYVYGAEQDFSSPVSTVEGEEEEAESSSFAMARPRSHDRRRCEACHEDKRFFEVARAPCQHEYCGECLDELFRASISDESLFPPRCCKDPIPFEAVRIFLSSSLAADFKEKRLELETPNRTYCWSSTCSTFINPNWIADDVATCPTCQQETCVICKHESHQGDCPNDEALQQLLATAKGQGWQRCYKCWRVVELEHGCNHMTCLCRAQFCYTCGEAWKTCSCEQWDEHRLLARATQIHDREPIRVDQAPAQVPIELPIRAITVAPNLDIDPAPEAEDETTSSSQAVINSTDRFATPALQPELRSGNPRANAIGRIMQNLRENHDCDHQRWNYVRGCHQCEECYDVLPKFIFECRQCQLQACNRCRRNRL